MREVADRERVAAFMAALARHATAEVRSQFARMEPELFRFPAIDPPAYRRAADAAFPPSTT